MGCGSKNDDFGFEAACCDDCGPTGKANAKAGTNATAKTYAELEDEWRASKTRGNPDCADADLDWILEVYDLDCRRKGCEGVDYVVFEEGTCNPQEVYCRCSDGSRNADDLEFIEGWEDIESTSSSSSGPFWGGFWQWGPNTPWGPCGDCPVAGPGDDPADPGFDPFDPSTYGEPDPDPTPPVITPGPRLQLIPGTFDILDGEDCEELAVCQNELAERECPSGQYAYIVACAYFVDDDGEVSWMCSVDCKGGDDTGGPGEGDLGPIGTVYTPY